MDNEPKVSIETLLAAHHKVTAATLGGVEKRLERIEEKLDNHKHGENPSWKGLMPIFVSIVGGMGWILMIALGG